MTRDISRQWTRLALVQAYALVLTDCIPESRLLNALTAESSKDFTHNPTGDVHDLQIDQFLIEMAFFIIGYTPLNYAQSQLSVSRAHEIIKDGGLDSHMHVCIGLMLCIYESRHAHFDTACVLIEQTRQFISGKFTGPTGAPC